jgi:hypothetical protein
VDLMAVAVRAKAVWRHQFTEAAKD